MVDKVTLYTDQFHVSKGSPIKIIPANYDHCTGEVIDEGFLCMEDDTPLSGKRAYNNDYGVNITIAHGKLKASFNPSTLIHGNNLYPLSFSQFDESISQVKRALANCLINTDVNACKLSRIDLCSDIQTDHNFELYKPALRIIKPRYMPNEDAKLMNGYFSIGNRSRNYCFYDKPKQLRSKDIDPSHLGINGENIMRGEVRFMNHRSVGNFLGVETITDLNRMDTFHHLQSIYKQVLIKDFFRNGTVNDKMGELTTDRDVLNAIRKRHPNKAVELFLARKLMTGIDPYGLDEVEGLMGACGYVSSTIHAKKAQLIEVFQLKVEVEHGLPSVAQLLDEIHTKFVA